MNLNALSKLTILYAEDDNDTANLTSLVLEDYVGRLLVAKNGQEALNLFKLHKVDLVITDILMPKMNGIELIDAIRTSSTHPDVPVVITTAHTETKYLLDAIRLRVDGYILKPINVEELLHALDKAILPFLQADEIASKNLLINAISTFVGGKKIAIIQFLLSHCDKDNIFYGSYEDIIAHLNVSKPTIVKTFKQLIDTGILIKIKNKVYKIHPDLDQNAKNNALKDSNP
ncbi:two-component system response regulator [Helicobacter cinaedi PAGU611]|uniref:Response regulator receiver domain protein n=1 Tax=Helicobacter cinaedi CCUG 18818 = ATCC BAA-847 TaxID=537971 RepID=A0ABN0BCT0_9HELI|nr:response regulator [Helicobacter cinaedi]AWK61648.1 DNA-binding response regulator [Helicobacter cinaedi]EFR46940.1 response regulator receiver domain protein [Helicobacter cinaedi CCUG 18818 = ATCC BAA-847]QOQ91551.1 response regulator [Helicobacter cinaedi]QOQ95749.1 response regulator [Helicobacter cinaedi]BAM12075.1 two-component system response regulator [Helicobacter cinaedi PAGU611]